MEEGSGERSGPTDGHEIRVGCIFRTAGLPIGMAILRYAYRSGTIGMNEMSDDLGFSLHSCRAMMTKMLKLGLFVKSGTPRQSVYYDLTQEGTMVAESIEMLLHLR